jgi:hypothetical protein
MATKSTDLDVESETDRLYQLPLEGFVEARNALAARLKSSGDKDGAARVKALARPNAPAWAANQVYWRARREFDSLLASVDRLQNAQLGGAAPGAALRDAIKERREALDVVLRSAEAHLTSAGYATNPDTLRRVSNTLEALAAEGGRPARARPGRLVKDLEPPGFDAFAAMAEAAPPTPSRRLEVATPAPRKPVAGERPVEGVGTQQAEHAGQRRADEAERLRTALAEAEKRLDRARRDTRGAAAALSVAEKRAEAARSELEEATRRLARANDRAAQTAQDEATAREEAERLSASRDAAETERDAALRALRALE